MTSGPEQTEGQQTEGQSEQRRNDRRAFLVTHLALALVAYIPLLRTAAGVVGADTKSYLYLDPARLLARAPSMWDPNIGTGTVSHQTIGYIWPMGPWFWLAERLGLPDWVAQRLWLGTIFFAAGAGVLFLLRTFGLPSREQGSRDQGRREQGPGPAVAAVAYMFSPYVLAYAARASAILLPWAALPWLIALFARALRKGGWWYPAVFAAVVTTVGTVNASALAFAGLAVACWVPFAIWSTREVTVRRALGAIGRIGALTLLTQLWWLVALVVGGRWGIGVLRVTETIETVAESSTATEVLRGLGNWFFYGNDSIDSWVQASKAYVQDPWFMALSFGVPVMAFFAAFTLRWALRAYFALLVFVGTVIAVGAHPYDDPSPLGSAITRIADSSSIGLALRNVQRAVPLVALGLACLLGAGISALAARYHRLGSVAALIAASLAVASFPPLWQQTLVDPNISRPEKLPSYWPAAIDYLDGQNRGTRVLEIPGTDFATYRWGNTIDPITPGLMDRPYVAQELLPLGSVASSNLLRSLDRRIQEGVFEPSTLAPMARLLGAGDVVLRSDLQFERYLTPRPRALWQLLMPSPAGLGDPVTFGKAIPNTSPPEIPMLDEIALALPTDAPHPPPVAVFPVLNRKPIVRAAPADRLVLLAGDGEGIVDAAAEGLLDDDRLLRYSGSLDSSAMNKALGGNVALILTDSNRRRAQRFTIIRENYGFTEEADEKPLRYDVNDARLELFPGAGDDTFAVAERSGVRSVRASSYGSLGSYHPESRATQALDGNPWTSWQVGDFSDPVGERLVIEFERPVTTDRFVVTQPIWGSRNRWITKATLRFDTGDPVHVALTENSRAVEGQVIAFPARTISRIDLTIDATNIGRRARYDGVSPVGIAELEIKPIGAEPVRVDELVRLPTDLLNKAGDGSRAHPLAVVLARARSNPAEPFRTDEEVTIARAFHLPLARTFSIRGTARISAVTDDATIDSLLGVPDASEGGITARSSGRLPGDINARAISALDGDLRTFWSPGLLEQDGHWLEYHLPRRVTLDRLDMVVIADGRHSTPARLRIEGDGGEVRTVSLPAPAASAAGVAENATASVPIRMERMTTARLKITVEAIHKVETIGYYGRSPITLPVAIAEVGIPGVRAPRPPQRIPGGCHTGLVTVDGKSIGVRLVGDRAQAERRLGLRLETCGTGAQRVDLAAGEHIVRTADGRATGVDIDRLVLESGGERTPLIAVTPAASVATEAPKLSVVADRRHELEVKVANATGPFWIVLGQSFNEGWKATVKGRSLGKPQLVDGMSNGWLVDADALRSAGESFTVTLRWHPQGLVTGALRTSALGALICILIIAAPLRRRFRRSSTSAPPVGDQTKQEGIEDTSQNEPAQPVLTSPFVMLGRRPRARSLVAWPLLAGMVTAAVIAPALGPLASAVTLVALLAGRARALLSAGAIGAFGAAAAYTVINQAHYEHPAAFGWATNFERVHVVAFAAVAILAIDALVELVRNGRTDSHLRE